ncbi:MAG: hypothetical protein LBO80_08595 [Treponema sp.]|jgi:hypothetical protein|nr:hypothetical protein [Treponema sp.]
MTFDPLWAFEGYAPALQDLESSFQKAGCEISFYGTVLPATGKTIRILSDGVVFNSISIEGDSPVQAIKDVAQAVNCNWARRPKGGAV